jgi:hypothetical protein
VYLLFLCSNNSLSFNCRQLKTRISLPLGLNSLSVDSYFTTSLSMLMTLLMIRDLRGKDFGRNSVLFLSIYYRINKDRLNDQDMKCHCSLNSWQSTTAFKGIRKMRVSVKRGKYTFFKSKSSETKEEKNDNHRCCQIQFCESSFSSSFLSLFL